MLWDNPLESFKVIRRKASLDLSLHMVAMNPLVVALQAVGFEVNPVTCK